MPRRAQRPTGPKTNSGAIPHRITPPGARPSPTSHGSARERRRRHPPPARRRQAARPAGTLPHHVGRIVLKASRPPVGSPHALTADHGPHASIGISLGALSGGAGRATSGNVASVKPGSSSHRRNDRRRRSRRISASREGRSASRVSASGAGSAPWGGDGWVDGNPGGRGHPGAVVVRLLAPAPATPGPGSHGDQIAHRLRAERRAIRMVRVEVPSDASPEDMLDRRPPPGDREGIEPRQELEVLGPFDVEVEGQVGTRSSGQRLTSLGSPGNHSRGPASIRSLTDV